MAGARSGTDGLSEKSPSSQPPINHNSHQVRGKLQNPRHIHEQLVMASQTISMSSGLIAIALVVRSGAGPRFVFHYPPHPTEQASKLTARFGTELDISDEDDEDGNYGDSDESEPEERGFQLSHGVGKLGLGEKSKRKKIRHVGPIPGDDHYDAPNGEQMVPWEHLGEFSTTDLEMILTPSRAFHKKKFELTLDPLYFVSYPMHIREDGLWKKKRPKKGKKSKREGSGAASEDGKSTEKSKKEEPDKDARAQSDDANESGDITMYNVVFVLNLPKHEADGRILIYEHVIKTLSKALKHAQAQDSFVWKESEMILSMKEKAREERRPMSWLWSEILAKSSLAGAIRDVFTAVSNTKIATVHLATNPALDLSLQIPVPSFLTKLPEPTERAIPGLLVTTANPLINDEGVADPTHLNKHFALLLLNDEDKIIAEIQADNSELSAPLIECIKLCKPTLSFLQVAQANSIELPSLIILAQHLIYWRRAVTIPPLHARETYIVSPNSDNHKLPAASIAWKKAFPLAPLLPYFLAHLSAAPRPYKSYFPSKNHRGTYLEMLGWLIRGGWVTQLRTFAWILVWPEIIYEVDYALKAEVLEKKANPPPPSENTSSSSSPDSNEESGSDRTEPADPSAPLSTEQAAENARLERLAAKAAADAAADAEAFSKRPHPEATAHPSVNHAAHLKGIAPYIILDPHKVSHEESLYIAAIGKRLADDKVRDCWFKFAKYFNGSESLEMIGLMEGMKRKEAWGIVNGLQEHLLVTKHW